MESEPVDELPTGKGWQCEPKWDGFRCLAFKDGATITLQSRNQRPLGRYLPELEAMFRDLPVRRFRARVTKDAAEITKTIGPLIGGKGFTGRAPLGQSRWSDRKRDVVAVRPERVVEVSADHVTSQRFRHGARILRWREDKRPETCTLDQIAKRRHGRGRAA